MTELFRTCIALAFMIMLSASAWWDQTAIADDVLSPLVAIPIASPNPVLGADDKTHLLYEILLANMASGFAEPEEIETLDADGGAVIGTLEGDGLA